MTEEQAPRRLPRYPIYVPSKNRSDYCLTARMLKDEGVPFYLVLEPHQQEKYAAEFGRDNMLTLPFDRPGENMLVPARNWIKEHATAAGFERHWQLDDNLWRFVRRWKAKRIYCDAGLALSVVEDFTDRYENIAVSGMNYEMFIPDGTKYPPYYLNNHVYSCSLVLNSLPNRWRSRYNDDTDFCLQVLADGWCTVLTNAFAVWKSETMLVKGGNTDIYLGDGRLKMARALERLWPRVVSTQRRFRRPQHVVAYSWRRFDTPLKLKEGIDLSAMKPDEYGMRLVKMNEIKSPSLAKLVGDIPLAPPGTRQPSRGMKWSPNDG